MTTNQPKWQLVANLGDVNPFDHGGFFIWKDLTGKYDLEATILLLDEENEDKIQEVRILMEKCNALDEFFADDLDSIASFAGQDRQELIDQLASDEPIARGRAYQALTMYYNVENFGGDGWEIRSIKEVKRDYARKYAGLCTRQK
jgi:hypothetical protein